MYSKSLLCRTSSVRGLKQRFINLGSQKNRYSNLIAVPIFCLQHQLSSVQFISQKSKVGLALLSPKAHYPPLAPSDTTSPAPRIHAVTIDKESLLLYRANVEHFRT
jgi:hypothetical protein